MVHERIPAEKRDPRVLGEKLKFPCGRVAKNRFMKAAMTEKISSWHITDLKKRGIPSDQLVNVYEKWGHGGYGLILTGNFIVEPNHLEAVGNAIISRENDSVELRNGLRRVAQAAKSEGSLAVVQLSHGGRQVSSSIYDKPISASDVQLIQPTMHYAKPKPATQEDINDVIDRFVFAAKRSKEAGFDGVQIHAAHGYLLSQFLSPTTNLRTDKYGGNVENRARLLLEIYDAIRAELPQETGFLVGVKLNSVEFQEKGLQADDARSVCKLLEERGVDFVELSGGNYERFGFNHVKESTRKREAFFLEFSDKIRPVFKNTILYVTGGFRTVSGMVDAINSGSTQGIGLGRPSTAEPDLPKKLLSGTANSCAAAKFPEDQFMTMALASGSQIVAMGEKSLADSDGIDDGIPDFSDPKEVQRFNDALAGFFASNMEAMANNQPVVFLVDFRSSVKVR